MKLTTNQYENLSGINAYSFARNYESLFSSYESDNFKIFIFASLYSNDSRYKIDTASSGSSLIYYLECDGKTVFTVKNNKVMYNIFD